MKVFVTIDDDGQLSAASTKNPIECMELIEKDKSLSSTFDKNGNQPEDMINFEDFLTQFISTGKANIIEIVE